MTATQRLMSVGEIAAMLHTPVHRVTYIVNARQIRETDRAAGRLRLFGSDAVQRIAQELGAGNTQQEANQ